MIKRQENQSKTDEASQKELGMAAEGWRQANALERCAHSLVSRARMHARDHTWAAVDADKAKLDPQRTAPTNSLVQQIITDHYDIVGEYLVIADAHKVVANRARAESDFYARMLINGVTPELVQQRLSALPPAIAKTIKRRFGEDLADARIRARVFEACDFAQWTGGVDEKALREHESISTSREYL
jgi:hypothetical protein